MHDKGGTSTKKIIPLASTLFLFRQCWKFRSAFFRSSFLVLPLAHFRVFFSRFFGLFSAVGFRRKPDDNATAVVEKRFVYQPGPTLYRPASEAPPLGKGMRGVGKGRKSRLVIGDIKYFLEIFVLKCKNQEIKTVTHPPDTPLSEHCNHQGALTGTHIRGLVSPHQRKTEGRRGGDQAPKFRAGLNRNHVRNQGFQT